jgi:hypothetical protein
MSRVIVAGSRHYDDRKLVYYVLDKFHFDRPIGLLIHGSCPYGGADILAEDWAKDREIPYMGIPAMFKRLGPPGGPYRNSIMTSTAEADYGIFFPGGSGTNDCREKLIKQIGGESCFDVTPVSGILVPQPSDQLKLL